MGSKKGKKLLAIEYMTPKLGLIVIPKNRHEELGQMPGAFPASQVRTYLPVEHINHEISGFVEKNKDEESEKKPKKKDKDLKAEPYIKNE